ncbi:hypothetical protein F2Q68_00039369 [Brassica cretica]|uniref:Arabidopsis retrotransposon Orf1 C-terminal domain-containing protein n=1 Tax=Brassica cretica TaxID=69181 RepID=A0A8S9MI75_BRACR|nr:hypothetical protein F2Q68_00039369 [Brassica cretica]
MLQMQQTIQNQQQAAQEQATVNAAREERGALTGERNLPWNFATNRSPINPPPCTRQDYEIKPALIVSYEFRNTLDSSCNGDFMTQTTPGAFALIENMASSSLNKNKEHDRSKSVNSIDDLAAKVDQLLKGNQSQVFIMEEATPEKSAGDLAFEAELSGDDQQEVSYVNGQGWQLKNYHPNPNVRNNQQLFWPKQDKPTDPAQSNQGQYAGYQKNYQPRAYVLSQPQNNTPQMQKHQNPQPATSAPIVAPQDETKVMLQQLLQGQQLQGKALNQLNEIYETATEPKGVAVAKKFSPSNAFWDCIANGNFTPGKAYQSQIRNPALWVIAKIISNLMFAKDLTSKVTNGELQTLYAGIEDKIRASGSGIPIQKVKTNSGFNFMTMICERRQCLMHGSNKKDRSGSLLTPLFKHFSIYLGKYSVNKEVQYLDIKYLMACHIMCDEESYSFFDKDGTQLFTKLPHPEITRFSVFDNMRFLPPPELLCTDPRAAAPDADMEDVEDITAEAEPSYDLGELADVTDDQAYRRWMVDSQRMNSSLMRRILHLITGGCIGGSNQRQPPAEQTPRSHRPGKAPMGTSTLTEEVHRSRNRRVAVVKTFSPSKAFWDCIANGNFTPGKAYQSQIRNPTLWVIAKIISNLLFAKDLTSKVTNGELQTLYAGIENEIQASGSGIPIQKVKTNPGFNFMTTICERRQCLMHGSNKKDRSGSLLTPLFKHFGIDLGKYSVNKEVQYLDIKYLMACHIMRDEDTYSFFDKAGTQLFTKLPHPEITRFSVFDNIRFLPPPELLCTDPRAAAPDADMEDVEDITPEAEPSYDLGELADVTDDQAYRRGMVDSQRKNNSLMRRILHLITGGCIGGSNQRQPPAEQTPRSHRPGKTPMGTCTSTERFIARATDVKTNPGFNFMTMICERRQCLMHGSNKKDRSGSLLTPLFKHFDIDLGKYSVNKEVQYLDIKYLMACHIMRDEETYIFFDKAGTQLFTKLPHPEITRFSVFDNIRFLPPPELLCTDPRAAAPDVDMEDVEDITP